MAAQKPVQEAIDKFLADNRNLAGSRDGFPALALNLNRARELAEYVDGLHGQIAELESQRDEFLKNIYSYAIGEAAMGMVGSFEDLAQSAFAITNISDGDLKK